MNIITAYFFKPNYVFFPNSNKVSLLPMVNIYMTGKVQLSDKNGDKNTEKKWLQYHSFARIGMQNFKIFLKENETLKGLTF